MAVGAPTLNPTTRALLNSSRLVLRENVTSLAKKMGHYFLAFYNLEFKRDYDEALREVDITLKLAPADPSVICNMGIVSIGSGRPDFRDIPC